MNESPWRKCPLCGSWSFYIDNEDKSISVFKVNSIGNIIFNDPEKTVEINENTNIHCLSCSWNGTIEDLD